MTPSLAATTLANYAVNGRMSAKEATKLERILLDALKKKDNDG